MKLSNDKLSGQRGTAGFTLVEVLVATAIFGIIAASMFTLYINMQRTTMVQEDVVDLQQNVRIALDSLTRDIQMAGFMIAKTSDTPAISAASNGNTLVFNIASTVPKTLGAMIVDDPNQSDELEIPAGSLADDLYTFNVARADMTTYFEPGQMVRIVRPADKSTPYIPEETAPLGPELIVVGKDSGIHPPAAPTQPTITLKNFTIGTEPIQYTAGDLIVRVFSGTSRDPDNPPTVTWSLNGDRLERNGETLANEIAAVNFVYILSNGTTTVDPDTTNAENVVAVRITLTSAVAQIPGETPQQRQVSGVVNIRNI